MKDLCLGISSPRRAYSFRFWNSLAIKFGLILSLNRPKQEQTEAGISLFDFGLTDYTNTRTKSTPTFMMTFTGFF